MLKVDSVALEHGGKIELYFSDTLAPSSSTTTTNEILVSRIIQNYPRKTSNCEESVDEDQVPSHGYKRHGRAVLTDEQARDIFRNKPVPRSKARDRAGILAREFGVTVKAVRDIWKGRTWYRVTSKLDSSQPVSAERLQKRPGRPRGAKDSRPRINKAPSPIEKAVADAIGLDPRVLLQLTALAHPGALCQPNGGLSGIASAVDLVAAAARLLASSPPALCSATAASVPGGSPEATPVSTSSISFALTAPAAVTGTMPPPLPRTPFHGSNLQKPNTILADRLGPRCQPATATGACDGVAGWWQPAAPADSEFNDPFHSDFPYWSSRDAAGAGDVEPLASQNQGWLR